MKKITVLFALTLVLIFSAQQKANAGHVHVNVSWGMLWGCAAPGMCKVDIDVEWLTVATYNGDANGGTLVINANKREIDGDKLKFFEGDQFEFAGDVQLPSNVCQGLGMEEGSIIPKGRYQLKDAGDAYIITIPIKIK